MKKSIRNLLYLAVFLIAWPASTAEPWEEVSSQIIIVISVITAAVFVRLNRALPKMEVANFSQAQIQRISDSYVSTSKELAFFTRIIIGVLGYGVLGIKLFEDMIVDYPNFVYCPRYVLCVLFGYVLVRSLKLITLDLEFMRLQSEIACHEAKLSAKSRMKEAE